MTAALHWRLARRILLPRRLRIVVAVATLVVPLALLVAGHSTLQALTLSGEQVAQRELGSADVRIDLPRDPEGRAESAEVRALLPAGTEVLIRVGGLDLPATDGVSVAYLESAWADVRERGHLRLLDGRVPVAPGETAVSRAVADRYRLVPGSTLELIGGRVTLAVTGLVEDPYRHRALLVFPAAGTADLLLSSPDVASNLGFNDQLMVYGLAGAQHDRFIEEARYRLDDLVSGVTSRVFDRSEFVATDPRSVVEREPALVVVPALVVPIVLAATALMSQVRRSRRSLALLDAVGMPPHSADQVAVLGAVTLVATGTGLGLVIGQVLGVGGRPLLVLVGGRDLSPYIVPVDLLAWICGSMLVATVAVVVLARRAARQVGVIERVRAPLLPARSSSRLPRRVALGVGVLSAVGGLLGVGAELAPVLGSLGLGLLAVLAFPELARRLPRAARHTGVLVRYSAGVLAAGRAAAGWVCGLALLVVVAATSVAILEDSYVAEFESTYVPNVLPGQIIVRELNGPVSEPALARIGDVVGVAPIPILQVGVSDPAAPIWRVDHPQPQGTGGLAVRLLQNVDQFGAVLGVEPTPADRAALSEGRALVWKIGVDGDEVLLTLTPHPTGSDPEPESVESRRIPAVAIGHLGAYAGNSGVAAVLLVDSAARLGLPITRTGILLPAGDGPPADRLAAVQAVVDVDGPAFTVVEGHQPFERPSSAPRTLLRDLGAWLVFAVAVAMFALLGRSRARDLHTLYSLGVPGWFRWGTSAMTGLLLGGYAVVGGLVIGTVAATLRIAAAGDSIAVEPTGVLPLAGWILVAMVAASVLAAPRQRRYTATGDQR